MLLRCPHCLKRADHRRSDFLGDLFFCPAGELLFAWRQPEGTQAGVESGNQTEQDEESKPTRTNK